MAVRNHDKSGTKSYSNVTSGQICLPEIDHPLKFWTLNATEPCFIDFAEFSEGRHNYPRALGFTGRPVLIMQLSEPLIEYFKFYRSRSAWARQSIMRNWWRALDEISSCGEDNCDINGVEDFNYVNLSFIKDKLSGDGFSWLLSMLNVARVKLGLARLQMNANAKAQPNHYLPEESESKMVRMELKRKWQDTRNKWSLVDSYIDGRFIPGNAEQDEFQRHREYLDEICAQNQVVFPTKKHVQGAYTSFSDQSGLTKAKCYSSKFPNRSEVNCALHMCLASTGWNVSVICSMDATRLDVLLYDHPNDPSRYVLCDTKPRAKEREQFATGLWKTPWGAGYIIRLVESRSRLLRKELDSQIAEEIIEYERMQEQSVAFDLQVKKAKRIRRLQAGITSLWLFVDDFGSISWLSDASSIQMTEGGQGYNFMQLLVQSINIQRSKEGKALVPAVCASDFRDMFALFVWRQSGGNILAVMNVLSHARFSSTSNYIDNNIINDESDGRGARLIDEFFLQLKDGKFDLTLLAHSMLFGDIDIVGAERLVSYRTLERSRLGVGCKNSFNPPELIKTQSASEGRCTAQRCTLCYDNAVIFRDSLDGISMRAEELEALRPVVPVDTWIISSFDSELTNCLRILELFPEEEVLTARTKWMTLIAAGEHRFPGQ